MSSELAGSGQSGEGRQGGVGEDTRHPDTDWNMWSAPVHCPGSTPQSMACISIRMNWTEQLWCDGCGAAVNASSARAVSPCALLSAQPCPAQPSPAHVRYRPWSEDTASQAAKPRQRKKVKVFLHCATPRPAPGWTPDVRAMLDDGGYSSSAC